MLARGLAHLAADQLSWSGVEKSRRPGHTGVGTTPGGVGDGRSGGDDAAKPKSELRRGTGRTGRTRNGPVILAALHDNGELTVNELVSETSLTDGQVRYALAVLVESGQVVMKGQQGSHSTAYAISV